MNRRNVLKEVARVLKPGGMFVLTDSLQLGDTPSKVTPVCVHAKMHES
jgi:ubiquinone/menaquinone biosynthesis C-methylase UbiE